MLKYLKQDLNYGSLTHETRIKDAVDMEDLIMSFGDRSYP